MHWEFIFNLCCQEGHILYELRYFYSGFVYSMLDLPMELYTPMFAIARIAGWSAHRIEELVNPGKIIRPAYKSIAPHKEYVPLDSRD